MRITVFGIHPDDVELGCGGTVARCVALGYDVVIVDLTRGESSSNGTPQEREQEAARAAQILGCRTRENLELPDTRLVSEDADQLLRVTESIRRHRPDVVIAPLRNDPHPDHASGGALIERSVYLAGIHGYRTGGGESRWIVGHTLVYPGRRDLEPDVVFDVSDTFAVKMDAIRAHRSQFEPLEGAKETPLNRPGFLESVEARAVSAGHRIGVRYGEPFQVLRPIGLRDFSLFTTTSSKGGHER
jgi:bacillithiol biosynthesis deacetylase BshB1